MRSRRKLTCLLLAALGAGMLTAPGPAAAAPDLPMLTPAPQSIRRLGPDLPGDAAPTVVKETGSVSPRAAAALGAWSLPAPATLKPGGYVLGIGSHQGEQLVVLAGKDAAGTFYGEQTLAQLTATGAIPSVAIADEPAFALRGGMESFYGQPWRQADLLNHLDFLGRHRMNAFQYTVSGDPHTAGAKWREPYTGADVDRMREAIQRARSNHVEFIYRVNPEANVSEDHGICHALLSDKNALIARYQQLWDLGERVFSVGWDDVGGRFKCDLDQRTFGSDSSPLAAAQAHVVNDVYNRFIKTHPGARLLTVPTEYWGNGGSPYRTRFAQLIPADVDIFWTGREVVSPTITTADAKAASTAFGGRKLLIFDNYPVNDYAAMAQHLGPLVGRDAGLPQHVTGFLINEMQEAEASLIALGTAAEYAWNPAAYDPQAAWGRILAELGGPAAEALRRYAEVNTGSPLFADPSAPLTPLVRAFVDAYRGGADLAGPGAAVIAFLERLSTAPAELRSRMANPSFLADSEPWLTKTEGRSRAGIAAVRALQAKATGDLAGYRAQREQLHAALAAANTSFKIAVPGTLDELLDLAGTSRGTDVVRHDNGTMSVYERGRNGRVQTAWQQSAGGSWTAFADLPAVAAAGKPEVVVRRNGGLTAFVRATDGRLWTSEQSAPGSAWSGWTKVLDVAVGGDPAVIVGDDGLISLFVRGSDGVLQTLWQAGGGWRIAPLGGTTMLGKPAVDVALDGALTVVVRGSDNRLRNNWQRTAGGAWNGWVDLPGSAASDPDLVMSYNGSFSVFYRGTDNAVYTSWQPSRGAAFTGPARLGGITAQGSPRATLDNAGGLSLYVRGSDNRGWTMWQRSPGGNWQDGWLNDQQVAYSDVRIADSMLGIGSAFTIDANGRLRTSWQFNFGTSWSGWADLGGSLVN